MPPYFQSVVFFRYRFCNFDRNMTVWIKVGLVLSNILFFLVGHVYWEYSCLHIEKMLTFFADNPSSFSSICNYSYMFLFWFCFFEYIILKLLQLLLLSMWNSDKPVSFVRVFGKDIGELVIKRKYSFLVPVLMSLLLIFNTFFILNTCFILKSDFFVKLLVTLLLNSYESRNTWPFHVMNESQI